MTITVAIAAAAASASAPALAASSAAVATSPGLIMATLGFISGLMLTWPALIGLLFFGILFEHKGARGWAVFSALSAAAVVYFLFQVSLITILIGIAGYVVIGLLWSAYRYKRHVSDVVEEFRSASPTDKSIALRKLHPTAMIPTLTAWILIWPFSLVENFVGDLLTGIEMLVTKVFRGVYHRMYQFAVQELS